MLAAVTVAGEVALAARTPDLPRSLLLTCGTTGHSLPNENYLGIRRLVQVRYVLSEPNCV